MFEISIRKYIEQLTSAYPTIQSIWLFGSRANETQRIDSDWDLLVFGTQEILEALKFDQTFHQKIMDLLVVYNGNNFENPWEEEQKSGSLIEWCWKESSANEATYRATKGIFNVNGEEEFNIKMTQCKAYRVYPS